MMNGVKTGNYMLAGKTMYNKSMKKKRNDMRRKLWLTLAIIAALFLGFLGGSVVTANAKVTQDMSYENVKRYKYYTTVYVTRDLTLWDIAEEYATEEYSSKQTYIDEVMEINQLANDKLSYGSTICVPYYSDEYK